LAKYSNRAAKYMVLVLLLRVCLASRPSRPPLPLAFFEPFSSTSSEFKWIPSALPNYTGAWQIERTQIPRTHRFETALVTKTLSARSAISTTLPRIDPANRTIVLQYEMRPQMAFTCSGAYIKVFSTPDFDPRRLSNETRYAIMFGPDRCASSNRIHFIFQHFHPIRKRWLQKALRDPPEAPTDIYTHLYTLVIRPNATFSMKRCAEWRIAGTSQTSAK
jgi:calnexin